MGCGSLYVQSLRCCVRQEWSFNAEKSRRGDELGEWRRSVADHQSPCLTGPLMGCVTPVLSSFVSSQLLGSRWLSVSSSYEHLLMKYGSLGVVVGKSASAADCTAPPPPPPQRRRASNKVDTDEEDNRITTSTADRRQRQNVLLDVQQSRRLRTRTYSNK